MNVSSTLSAASKPLRHRAGFRAGPASPDNSSRSFLGFRLKFIKDRHVLSRLVPGPATAPLQISVSISRPCHYFRRDAFERVPRYRDFRCDRSHKPTSRKRAPLFADAPCYMSRARRRVRMAPPSLDTTSTRPVAPFFPTPAASATPDNRAAHPPSCIFGRRLCAVRIRDAGHPASPGLDHDPAPHPVRRPPAGSREAQSVPPRLISADRSAVLSRVRLVWTAPWEWLPRAACRASPRAMPDRSACEPRWREKNKGSAAVHSIRCKLVRGVASGNLPPRFFPGSLRHDLPPPAPPSGRGRAPIPPRNHFEIVLDDDERVTPRPRSLSCALRALV